MAIKNKFAVYIDGINYTSRAVMPLKFGDLLDEQLDEAHLALRKCKHRHFPPLTPVEIDLDNKLYFDAEETPIRECKATRYYLVAEDRAQEALLGKGFYNHDIALIELTKYLECIVVDTVTFTNDIGRMYGDGANDGSPINILDGGTLYVPNLEKKFEDW